MSATQPAFLYSAVPDPAASSRCTPTRAQPRRESHACRKRLPLARATACPPPGAHAITTPRAPGSRPAFVVLAAAARRRVGPRSSPGPLRLFWPSSALPSRSRPSRIPYPAVAAAAPANKISTRCRNTHDNP